jgi:hypothetical protein
MTRGTGGRLASRVRSRVSLPTPSTPSVAHQSVSRLSVSMATPSGPQATPLDRHGLQMRWAFESLSNAPPQRKQRTWRMPPGHRLTERADARHSRCAISPCSRMRNAPRTIGPEQMGHIVFGEAINPPFPQCGGDAGQRLVATTVPAPRRAFPARATELRLPLREPPRSRILDRAACIQGRLHASLFCIMIIVQ